MTDAGERAREILIEIFCVRNILGEWVCELCGGDIKWPDHKSECSVGQIAAALADLETENAELRVAVSRANKSACEEIAESERLRARDALDGQAALDEANNLVVTLKAEVDRLRKEQDRLYTEVNLTNVRLAEENARLRAATSAEAGKVVEAARELRRLTGVMTMALRDDNDGRKDYLQEVGRTEDQMDRALATYDRAQAQKEEKHGPGTDH